MFASIIIQRLVYDRSTLDLNAKGYAISNVTHNQYHHFIVGLAGMKSISLMF
jgi:hypothetical protein